MAEAREVHEFPIHILQEMISILLINKDDFNGEGKVNDYYLLKKGKFATVIYDNSKVSYVANFVEDKDGNWFFVRDIIVDQSLTSMITDEDIDMFKELFEALAEKEKQEQANGNGGLNLGKEEIKEENREEGLKLDKQEGDQE